MFPWMTYPNVYQFPMFPGNKKKGKKKSDYMSLKKALEDYKYFEDFMEWKAERDKKKGGDKKDDKKPEKKGVSLGTTEWFVIGLILWPLILGAEIYLVLNTLAHFGVNLLK